ncbi:MAG: hypothetical protein KBA51_02510 [Kiritimatiellae bacterium]|nr:hypothetical protein [Kiritimatiellia bacterium]
MSDEPPILEFANAIPPGDDAAPAPALHFALRAGELGVIETTEQVPARVVADLTQGLLDPAAGEVRYRGRAWPRIPHDEACRLRGMEIGRVFSLAGWVGNLDVDENLTLAGRHFDSRPESELLATARDAVRRVGLPDIPEGRPAWLAPRALQLAQWARALQHPRRLLILEFPLRKTFDSDAPRLADALRAAARDGAAVLWIGPGADVLERAWPPAARIRWNQEKSNPEAASAAPA